MHCLEQAKMNGRLIGQGVGGIFAAELLIAHLGLVEARRVDVIVINPGGEIECQRAMLHICPRCVCDYAFQETTSLLHIGIGDWFAHEQACGVGTGDPQVIGRNVVLTREAIGGGIVIKVQSGLPRIGGGQRSRR